MRKAEFDRNKCRVSDAETDVIGGTTPPFSGQSHPRLTRTYGVVIPVTRAHPLPTRAPPLSLLLSFRFTELHVSLVVDEKVRVNNKRFCFWCISSFTPIFEDSL